MDVCFEPQSFLARPPVASEQLREAGLELVLLASPCSKSWRVPTTLLAKSFVVQKQATRSSPPFDRSFSIYFGRVEDLQPYFQVSDWPRNTEDWGRWIQACDYLLIDLEAHELAFSISNSLRGPLQKFRDVWRLEPLSREALHLTRQASCTGTLDTVRVTDTDGYNEYEPAIPEVAVRSKEAWRSVVMKGLLEPFSTSGLTHLSSVISQVKLFVLEKAPQEIQASAKETGALKHVCPDMQSMVAVISEALLATSLTCEGSLYLLENIRDLIDALGVLGCRYLVQRAFATLLLAESYGELVHCYVPLRILEDLQQLYAGEKLTLNCFMPILDNATYFLPGLLGRNEVAPLFSDPEEVFRRAVDLVPWLTMAMRGTPRLCLTGSLLCFCRSRYALGTPPRDVDLFCEEESQLEDACELVCRSMQVFAASVGCGGTKIQRINPRRTRVLLERGRTQSASEGSFADFCFSCDVYVNSTVKVSRYHLAQVRGLLRLQDGGRSPELLLTASAGISWITMISIDYHEIVGSRSPRETIAAYWERGFNLCLKRHQLAEMTAYLQENRSEQYLVSKFHQRPQRLVPFCASKLIIP